MRHNLIKTENYLLVVDDSEIKEGDWYFDTTDKKALNPIYQRIQFSGYQGCKKIVAHLPLDRVPVIKSIPVLPSLNQEDEAEEIFPVGKHGAMHMPNREMINNALRQQAYNKAKEKYKYTEEDMLTIRNQLVTILPVGNVTAWDLVQAISKYTKWFDDYIQSLQQSIPIAFECVDEYVHDETVPYPKTLGTQPKTIINSEGRTEWVGKYIYE
jgi:hypothetical protein